MTMQTHFSDEISSEEAAVRDIYYRVMDGWNKGSGEEFASVFADDSDLVGFDGTHIKGRKEISLFHQELFDKYVKGSKLVGKVKSVRFITDHVALMHSVGGTVMAGQSDIDPERNSIQTCVMTKSNYKWSIAAFQNTRVQYIGRPDLCQALTEELRKEIDA